MKRINISRHTFEIVVNIMETVQTIENYVLKMAYKYINKRVIVNITCKMKSLELHVIYTNKKIELLYDN